VPPLFCKKQRNARGWMSQEERFRILLDVEIRPQLFPCHSVKRRRIIFPSKVATGNDAAIHTLRINSSTLIAYLPTFFSHDRVSSLLNFDENHANLCAMRELRQCWIQGEGSLEIIISSRIAHRLTLMKRRKCRNGLHYIKNVTAAKSVPSGKLSMN
jgi:hypothetical protein